MLHRPRRRCHVAAAARQSPFPKIQRFRLAVPDRIDRVLAEQRRMPFRYFAQLDTCGQCKGRQTVAGHGVGLAHVCGRLQLRSGSDVLAVEEQPVTDRRPRPAVVVCRAVAVVQELSSASIKGCRHASASGHHEHVP